MIYDEKNFKILLSKNNNILNDKLKILSNEINELFMNSDTNIKKMLLKKKIKTRHSKISFTDALCYIFNYSFIDYSKQHVVSSYNFENNINVNRTSYYKKELKIPISFYDKIFIKIKNLLNKYLDKNKNPFNIIAVDGTYSNTNIKNDKTLETCLNMGYYDATNHIPINLELKGIENKNKEISSFIDHIKNNNFDVNNLIFVFDRAYFSYQFIDTLNEYKLNFVIRIKNNCICIKDKTKIPDKITDNNVRFINYTNKIESIKKDKNNKDVKIEETIICNLVTNLNKEKYNDDLIKDIYLIYYSIYNACKTWSVNHIYFYIFYTINFKKYTCLLNITQ